MKNKHMSDHDRIVIENGLRNSLSFKAIATKIGKDCTTISKEVRKHRISKNSASFGRTFNNCMYRYSCDRYHVCSTCSLKRPRLCRSCKLCRQECDTFVEEVCAKPSKPPYVCNGCQEKHKCTLTKQVYLALPANKQYQEVRSEARKGFVIDEGEIRHLNELLVPLIKEQGQSIHHVFIHHKDEIMRSEKTLYNIINSGLLDVRNIDLPRKVRYRPRRKKSTTYKIDKRCLEGRRYEDFKKFVIEHPDKAVVQMDSVEGKKGESCLLTIHFIVPLFMVAIKRESNDSKSVIDFFNQVYKGVGKEVFKKLFPVILTDLGSEFSNPEAIEFDEFGERRTYLFYCHPSAPYEIMSSKILC